MSEKKTGREKRGEEKRREKKRSRRMKREAEARGECEGGKDANVTDHDHDCSKRISVSLSTSAVCFSQCNYSVSQK